MARWAGDDDSTQITDVIMTRKSNKKQAREAEELMAFVNIEKQRLDAYPRAFGRHAPTRSDRHYPGAEPIYAIMDEPTTR
jgi:ABC-type dipeptide/oligopeptide/nickel transport system ATPase component